MCRNIYVYIYKYPYIYVYIYIYIYMASLSSAFLSTSLNLSPGCASACTGLASPGINYMCFPVAAPRAEVIILHKRTLALACISVREPGCPQVGLGSVSGDERTFGIVFPPTPHSYITEAHFSSCCTGEPLRDLEKLFGF